MFRSLSTSPCGRHSRWRRFARTVFWCSLDSSSRFTRPFTNPVDALSGSTIAPLHVAIHAVLNASEFLVIVLMLILLVICWVSPSTFSWWHWRVAPVFRLVDQLAYTLSCLPNFRRTRWPTIIHLVLLERSRKHHPPPSLPSDSIERNTGWIFTCETSPSCSSLSTILTQYISAALFRQRNMCALVMDMEARKSLNTQDKSERLTTATGHRLVLLAVFMTVDNAGTPSSGPSLSSPSV